jgi:hypothetical protein
MLFGMEPSILKKKNGKLIFLLMRWESLCWYWIY